VDADRAVGDGHPFKEWVLAGIVRLQRGEYTYPHWQAESGEGTTRPDPALSQCYTKIRLKRAEAWCPTVAFRTRLFLEASRNGGFTCRNLVNVFSLVTFCPQSR
jgi:hypothetical protein